MFSALEVLVALGLLVSTSYFVAVYFAARRFFTRQQDPDEGAYDEDLPGISVLKPLKGLDVDLYENLASFCRQDYPRFQLVFAVADPADAAIRVVQRLRQRYRHLDIELVIDDRVHGANRKVSNLLHAYERAKYDYIVVADSDIRVPPDYLRRLIGPLSRPAVGVVTCLYRAVPVGGLPARLEALFVNTDFSPSVFVAQMVEVTRYAFGATMALRRSVLEEIGGFLSLAPFLADDFFLGQKVAQRGYRVLVSAMIVETVMAIPSWQRLWEHQLRWARTYRSVRPYSYLALSLTYGVAWAVLNVLLHPTQAGAWAIAFALTGLRLYSAHRVATRYLGVRMAARDLLLIPVKDLLTAGVWAAAFCSNRVIWSGRRFRLIGGGEMIPEDEEVFAPTVPAKPAESQEGRSAVGGQSRGLNVSGTRSDQSVA